MWGTPLEASPRITPGATISIKDRSIVEMLEGESVVVMGDGAGRGVMLPSLQGPISERYTPSGISQS